MDNLYQNVSWYKDNQYYVISHCRTDTKMATINYTWNITRFSKIYKFIEILEADNVDGMPLKLFLKIDSVNNRMSFFVLNPLDNLKASCHVVLKCVEENEIDKVVFMNPNRTELCDIDIAYILDSKQKYLPDDTLTLNFEFYLLEEIGHTSISTDILETYEAMDKHMEELNLVDTSLVTFVTSDEPIYANKALLRSHDNFYQSVFTSTLAEENKIDLLDVSENVVKELLCYVQFRKSPEASDIEALCNLLVEADKFNVIDLKEICENQLMKLVTMENVIKLLSYAQICNGNNLKNFAKQFIVFNFENIANTVEFGMLIREHPELLNELLLESAVVIPKRGVYKFHKLKKVKRSRT